MVSAPFRFPFILNQHLVLFCVFCVILWGWEVANTNACACYNKLFRGLRDNLEVSWVWPTSHNSPNQKLNRQKIFGKLKPKREVLKNVTILGRTTEIHKEVKINTVDQILFLVRVVRIVINMNLNQAFCFAFPILLLFAFFILYRQLFKSM